MLNFTVTCLVGNKQEGFPCPTVGTREAYVISPQSPCF